MLNAKVQEVTLEPTLATDDINRFKKLYRTAVGQTKTDIVNRLATALLAWQPSPEALASYPFLAHTSKLISDYQEAIVVQESQDDTISLIIDKAVLKRKGLPENLPSLLEYGNQLVKPLPHIRPVVESSDSPVSSVVKRLKEEM